jgi:hypothetical protein
MRLIDDTRALLLRLWGHPGATWSRCLAAHGWKRTTAQLEALGDRALQDELTEARLTVDRSQPGFGDFARHANRLLTPGRPGASLLYHALASPEVHPSPSGRPLGDATTYPTLAELDTLENLIYGLAADRNDLGDTFVAVFAYQYRPARRSPHGVHADLAFSRTGIARVGTAPAHYARARRSFWVLPEDGDERIAVMPARYGAFLARLGRAPEGGSVLGGAHPIDGDYVFPVHKLFNGRECLAGKHVRVRFAASHRDRARVRLQPVGASVLVTPLAHDTRLTEPTVRFHGPSPRDARRGPTRSGPSTMEISAFGDVQLEADELEEALRAGGPLVAGFTDETGEGCVVAEVQGAPRSSEDRPAYSLVTVPDVFPLADQIEVARRRGIETAGPLSLARHLVNATITLPSAPATSAFRHVDLTVTAIVGGPADGPPASAPGGPSVQTSFLPDAVFDAVARGRDVELLDEELGFRPRQHFWEGDHEPFFETAGDVAFVNHAAVERSDHVGHARVGHVRVALTAEVQTADLLARARALDRCQALLQCQHPAARADCLVVARRVADWATANPRHPELRGPGFLYVFAKAGPPQPTEAHARVRRTIHEIYTCQVSDHGIALQRDAQPFRFFPGL